MFHAMTQKMHVLGQDSLLRFGKYPQPDVLTWGNRHIAIDGNLPGRLWALVPMGQPEYNQGSSWEAFVIAACAMGVL